MSFLSFLAISMVVLIWGCNFIFIKLGLETFHPLFLCTLRFFFASIPAIFILKKPSVPFPTIILYGILMFGLQFTFLFTGMHLGITPGLASVIIQVQVFFSIFFAMFFLKESPTIFQILGALVSFSGILIVMLHLNNSHIPLAGFICIIFSAASWGLGNFVTKRIVAVNPLSLVAWGSFIACFPLLIASLVLEGYHSIFYSLEHITTLSIISLFYIVYLSTWFGYGVWNFFLNRYPITTVAPFTLLVPIIALLSSAIFLHEPLLPWKITAGTLVMSGLAINIFSGQLKRYFNAAPALSN